MNLRWNGCSNLLDRTKNSCVATRCSDSIGPVNVFGQVLSPSVDSIKCQNLFYVYYSDESRKRCFQIFLICSIAPLFRSRLLAVLLQTKMASSDIGIYWSKNFEMLARVISQKSAIVQGTSFLALVEVGNDIIFLLFSGWCCLYSQGWEFDRFFRRGITMFFCSFQAILLNNAVC